MKKKINRKLVMWTISALMLILFILAVTLYIIYGQRMVTFFAVGVAISSLYFIFYLTFLTFSNYKDDIKKEFVEGFITPYKKKKQRDRSENSEDKK